MKKVYVKEGNDLREIKLEHPTKVLVEFPIPVQREKETEPASFRYPKRTALDRRLKVC